MDRVNTDGCTESRSTRPVHRLQGIRYAGRDYRIPAFYMITMTTLNRNPLFATCENAKSTLNDDGWLVYQLWHRMAKDYPQVETSTLVIMPDHLHGIVRVKEQMVKPVGVPLRAFKSQVTSALRKQYGKYFDLCLHGKLLILACRPCTTTASPLTREMCLRMNRWCADISGSP
jgi:REP element-mobilizing transposase RayT